MRYETNLITGEVTEHEDAEVIIIPETAEQIIARLERAIDRYLDEQAQSLRYESIRTLVTYIRDPNPRFMAEGVAGLTLRSACYTQAIGIIDAVQTGQREVPTEEELIDELPKITDYLNYPTA